MSAVCLPQSISMDNKVEVEDLCKPVPDPVFKIERVERVQQEYAPNCLFQIGLKKAQAAIGFVARTIEKKRVLDSCAKNF